MQAQQQRTTTTNRRPSPLEHSWTQKQNATDVFSTRDEDSPIAPDGKLEVAPELIRPRFHLLGQLPEKERAI